MKQQIVLFVLLSAVIPAAGAQRRKAVPLTFDVVAVNDPATQPDLGPDAQGDAVLRAQILLESSHFSVGQIDGRFGRKRWWEGTPIDAYPILQELARDTRGR